VLTTFTSYGEVPSYRQAEIFHDLRMRRDDPADDELPSEVVAKVIARLSGR
jgi:hypothetical protein